MNVMRRILRFCIFKRGNWSDIFLRMPLPGEGSTHNFTETISLMMYTIVFRNPDSHFALSDSTASKR